ncbi:DUF6894 family protein [Neorhizobium sp. SOG26]|uniref:DUF6894 family protein n=1 Tax=Neorhizobium sp. SOG26 TaxID=2060726 RepID=UPI004040A5CC
MRFFIHAHGAIESVFDANGLEFSSEEQAVNEIVATLREYVEELQRKGEPVPFQRVDIVDEDGELVHSFSSAECFASDHWLPVSKEPKH